MRLGVLGAMDAEIEAIVSALDDASWQTTFGCRLTAGLLNGQPVVVACSGIGKVNAALATTALRQAGVDQLVLVGMAGAAKPGISIGDAVVATDLVQHDVDITAFGDEPGYLNGQLAGGTADATLASRLADAAAALGVRVHRGRIASGDQFIASPGQANQIAARFDAVAVEMEGAAVAQTCQRLGLPFAVLRWISDSADEQAATDFPVFLARIAELDLAVVGHLCLLE